MRKRINLLLPKEQSLSDKLIYFALHYLRYILVITQIVVIGVFFYRFKVDQQIIDLKDELAQKQEIVLVSQPLIKEAQLIDRKIKSVTDILQKQELTSQMLDYILSRFPEQIRLNDLKISGSTIDMKGISESATVIQIYYARLKKEKKFTIIDLSNIKKTPVGFSFNLKLENYQYKFL